MTKLLIRELEQSKYTFKLEEGERTYILEVRDKVAIDEVVASFADFLVGCTFDRDQVDNAFKEWCGN